MAELSRADAFLLAKAEANAHQAGWLKNDEHLLWADLAKLVTLEHAAPAIMPTVGGVGSTLHRLFARTTFSLCRSESYVGVFGHGPASQYFSIDRLAASRYLGERRFDLVVVSTEPCRYLFETIGRNSASRAEWLADDLAQAAIRNREIETPEVFAVNEAGRRHAVERFK